MALLHTLGNIHSGRTVSRLETRYSGIYLVFGLEKQTYFYCGSLMRSLKDRGLSAVSIKLLWKLHLFQRRVETGEKKYGNFLLRLAETVYYINDIFTKIDCFHTD